MSATRISDMLATTVLTTGDYLPFVRGTETANRKYDIGAAILARPSVVTPQMFGAVGDDATNDGAAFVAAIAYLKTLKSTAVYGEGCPSLFIPASKYYLGTTTLDITCGIHIYGESLGEAGGQATQLRWAAGATGIRVQRYDTIDATSTYAGVANTNGGDASIIEKLMLKGGYTASSADFYGIHLRARATIRDCYIYNFQGDGIYVAATSGGSPEGNANNFKIHDCFIHNCRNGIWTTGADVNAGLVTGTSFISNRLWGVKDESFLGNTYVGCHAATNTSGGYTTTNNNARCLFDNCYAESDQAVSATLAQRSLFLNGMVGGTVTGPRIRADSGQVIVNEFQSEGVAALSNWTNSMGAFSGAATDGALNLDNTNNRFDIYSRLWPGGTQKNQITLHNTQGVTLNTLLGAGWVRMQVNNADIAYAVAAGFEVATGLTYRLNGATVINSSGAFVGGGGVSTTSGAFSTTLSCNGNATLGDAVGDAHTVNGTLAGTNSITSSHATAGIGYATGAGGAATQGTSRTTTVPLNKVCGAITLFSAAGSATWTTFTVTNTTVAATDVIRVVQKSGTDKYMIHVTNVGASTFDITFATTGGTTTEQPVFNFAVIKAVAA